MHIKHKFFLPTEAKEIFNLKDDCEAFRKGIYVCSHEIPTLKTVTSSCLPAIIAGITEAPCQAVEIMNPKPEFQWSMTGVLGI